MFVNQIKRMASKGAILFCAGLVLVGLSGCDGEKEEEINIAELSIEQESGQCRTISFDEAVELKVQLSGMGSKMETQKLKLLSNAEEALSKIEADAKENGGQVAYYEFSGGFSIPEIEEMQGLLTTLIVVVDGEETASHGSRYMQLVEPPITKMTSRTETFSWTHGASSEHVDVYQEEALLSAVGYVAALIPTDTASIQYSNSLQLEFEVSIDML